MTERFDPKDPEALEVLAFDFSAGLGSGEQLSGTPAVAVSVLAGSDPSPQTLLNGAPGIDGLGKSVLQGVKAGVAGCDYLIKVVCPTSNPLKVLPLTAILPVRNGA